MTEREPTPLPGEIVYISSNGPHGGRAITYPRPYKKQSRPTKLETRQALTTATDKQITALIEGGWRVHSRNIRIFP